MLPVENKPKIETSFRGYGKLNPNLTFDNFVIGKANQLAFAAATQVAELPGVSYNPLFVYGGVGLGKTHLLQGIGNQVRLNNPQAKICYMHAERYVADVVRAYQTNNSRNSNSFTILWIFCWSTIYNFLLEKPKRRKNSFTLSIR